MLPRPPPWPSASICWQCQWRMTRHSRRLAQSTPARTAIASAPGRRALHSTQLRLRGLSPKAVATPDEIHPSFIPIQSSGIRKRLRLLQEEIGGPDEEDLQAFGNYPRGDEMHNHLSKLSPGAKVDDNYRDIKFGGDEDMDSDELITIGLFLKPGDIVELSQPGREPVLAVFVQQFAQTSQFYSVNGKWTHSRLELVSFAIPGAIDPALVEVLIPFVPTDPNAAYHKGDIHVPRQVGAPVTDILGHLTEEAERIYRTNAPILDTAYSVLADKTRTRMMTLKQIAKTLLGKTDRSWEPSPAALLAVRKALHHNQFRFGSDQRSQRLTNVFAIRPTDDVADMETVQEWIREYLEHRAAQVNGPGHRLGKGSRGVQVVEQFLAKARRLITVSRQYREPNNGFVGPCKTRYAVSADSAATRTSFGEEFSAADKQIITLFQSWVLHSQFAKGSSFHACCIAILQATGLYEGTIKNLAGEGTTTVQQDNFNHVTGHLFLQEIGVLTPYEDRTIYDEQLMLPSVRLSRNLELLITKAELTRRNPDFRDSMADLRRDWGATTVFCIDDLGAKEIDDGVSISSIPGSQNQFWVHVHVANPTAFFNKTHVLSGLAAHMTETVYTPQRTFPMLPKWATQNYFSLDRNRPVLTFSTRIDLSGNVLETKIQPGIIRKIISITPAEVSEYLGESEGIRTKRKIVVGGEVPEAPSETRVRPQLSPSEIQELRDMYAAARAMWEKRKAAGGIRIGQGKVEVRVFEKPEQPGLGWTPPSVERSRLILGDPIIELTANSAVNSTQQHIDSSNIIEEMMLMSCQTAASWCAERSIPAMYRGTVENQQTGELTVEELQEQLIFPYLKEHGRLSTQLGFRYMAALGKAIAHSSPIPHRIIGAESYLKVTSPLRRFSDMISHWQIEAALRYEAQTGKKFDANAIQGTDRPVLPFSKAQMQESIITLSPREQIIKATKAYSTQFWTTQALMRAFYYNEAPLPKTFKAWVKLTVPGSPVAVGFLPEYSMQIRFFKPAGTEIHTGDEWEVEISYISVFHRQIWVKPVRLIRRETHDI